MAGLPIIMVQYGGHTRWRSHAMAVTRDGGHTRWRAHAMPVTRDAGHTRWRSHAMAVTRKAHVEMFWLTFPTRCEGRASNILVIDPCADPAPLSISSLDNCTQPANHDPPNHPPTATTATTQPPQPQQPPTHRNHSNHPPTATTATTQPPQPSRIVAGKEGHPPQSPAHPPTEPHTHRGAGHTRASVAIVVKWARCMAAMKQHNQTIHGSAGHWQRLAHGQQNGGHATA
jgi:hypothetical protein